jgi:hypothetical protein
MTKVTDTLDEREKTYGPFKTQAQIADNLNNVITYSPNYANLEPYQREALRNICGKIGRILNGDNNHIDSWHDIGGYAKLVELELENELTKNKTHKEKVREAFIASETQREARLMEEEHKRDKQRIRERVKTMSEIYDYIDLGNGVTLPASLFKR